MGIETLASLALDAGQDILAPTVRNDSSVNSSDVKRGTAMYDVLTGGATSAGMPITEKTAMCVSAIYACVGLLSGAIASLSLPILQRTDGVPQRIDHPYWWLLNEQPNAMMSAAVFWEWLVTSLLLHGDSFAQITRDRAGNAVDLLPWRHRDVQVNRVGKSLVYVIFPENEKPYALHSDDMIHVPGLGFDGKNGLSPLRYAARNAAGIALAADQFSADFFADGAMPTTAITIPDTPNPETIDKMREDWGRRYLMSEAGERRNRKLPVILAGGGEMKAIQLNAEEAELIATRKFQVEDIARIYGVPPFMISHTETTSSWGSGVEQMGINFVKFTLQRHLTKFEQELNRKLFRIDRYFCEFNTASLERGDIKTRYEAYSKALGGSAGPGFMVQNEVRRLENLSPLEGGDKLTQWSQNAKPTDQTVPGK